MYYQVRSELARNMQENTANHISANHSLDQSYEGLQACARAQGRRLVLNSVSGLVSKIWYRIPFDQSALSISNIPATDSSKVLPGSRSLSK